MADLKLSDLPMGESVRSSGRTITEGDFSVLNHMMGSTSPLHVNADYCAKYTLFGVPVLGGGIVSGLFAAGWSTSDLYKRLTRDFGVRAAAGLGMTVRYRNPVKAGDTLYGIYRLKDARPSGSRPGYGVMTIEVTGENQLGEPVVDLEMHSLFSRPNDAAAGDPG
jgi:itaconyl-CoA hydratase